MRILHTLLISDEPLTSSEIAERIHVPTNNVSKALCRWMTFRKHMVKRLQKKEITTSGNWSYRYTITQYGTKLYLRYMQRQKQGKDLNLFTGGRKMEKPYIRVNYSRGCTDEEALTTLGFLGSVEANISADIFANHGILPPRATP